MRDHYPVVIIAALCSLLLIVFGLTQKRKDKPFSSVIAIGIGLLIAISVYCLWHCGY